MRCLRRTVFFLARLAIATFPLALQAADIDKEFEDKPRAEAVVPLPEFPRAENLIPIRVGEVKDPVFAIDARSVSVSEDGVISYTLVAVSSQGARNVSFEGMRCDTGERRFYAFGQSDGTWSKAHSDKWIRIRGSVSQYPVALFVDYFCVAGEALVYRAEDALHRLRRRQ